MCPGPPQSAYSAAFDQPFREHPEQRSNVVRTLIGSGRNMHPELAHRRLRPLALALGELATDCR
jgi:hypothetical protein